MGKPKGNFEPLSGSRNRLPYNYSDTRYFIKNEAKNKDLIEYSRETVLMFYNDAKKCRIYTVKAFITGGAGFIGSSLAETLLKKKLSCYSL